MSGRGSNSSGRGGSSSGGGGGGGNRGGSTPERSPNDDRSDAMNPKSAAYDADQENRSQQAKEHDD